MNRRFWLALAAMFFTTTSTMAGPILTIEGFPASYVPGDSFTISVKLSGAQNLASYFIELLLAAPGGAPAVDFAFDPVPTVPAATYVFPLPDSDGSFLAAVDVLGGQHKLVLSDFNLDAAGLNLVGVDTVAGIHDLIAEVTVRTTSGVSGPLSLTIDGSSLQLDTPDIDSVTFLPISIADFSDVLSSLPSGSVPQSGVPAVPEPASLLLSSIGIVGLALMRSVQYKKR